jgi:formylmethanofuran dehydrogenase subunit E-like metal-binding protein
MDAVNNKAGQMLGIELTEAQKRAFVVFMKETVDHYYTDNMQMPMVDSQAKKFVQEEFPKLSLAEAEGSTIRAIEAAVRNM